MHNFQKKENYSHFHSSNRIIQSSDNLNNNKFNQVLIDKIQSKKFDLEEENDEDFSGETKNENDLNENDLKCLKNNNPYLRAKAEFDFLDLTEDDVSMTNKIKSSNYNPNNLIVNTIRNQK